MVKFLITTKDDKVLIEAKDKDHAFAKYFKDIVEQKVSLEKIGNIIMLSDGEDEYPMRTVPLLWKMGAIGTRVAVDNLVEVLGVSRFKAKKLLKQSADADARLVPLIDELKLREEG
jgi:hypothetical protein